MIVSALKAASSYSVWSDPSAWSGTADVTHTGRRTHAGSKVTEATALTYSAFFCAFTLVAEAISMLSWHVNKHVPTGREKVPGHNLSPLLQTRANPEMSAATLRELLQGWAFTWGNGYAEIQRTTTGRPVWLWPEPPNRVDIRRDMETTTPEGRNPLVYVIKNKLNQIERVIPEENMFHLRNYSIDGITGLSTVRLAREAIGLGLSTEKFGAEFFGSGAHPTGVIESVKPLSADARERLKKKIDENYGPMGRRGTAVLEDAMTWKSIGIPPEDSQFLETRTFQVDEISRWTKVPPTMLAELSRAHFRNIEHLTIQFATRAVMPWVNRWEAESDWKLLSRQDRASGHFTRMNLNSAMRADSQTRSIFYDRMTKMGAYSVNDVLELEDRNTIGPAGDQRFVPMNVVPLDQAGSLAESRGKSNGNNQPPPGAQTAKKPMARMFGEAADRIVTKETKAIKSAQKRYKSDATFNKWLGGFHVEHRYYVADVLLPVAQALAELTQQNGSINDELGGQIKVLVEEYAVEHCCESAEALRQACSHNLVESLCDTWSAQRAAKMTDTLIERVSTLSLASLQEQHHGN